MENRKLLERFINELINMRSAQTISAVIPQKGAIVNVADRVLVGVVKQSSRKGYYQSFENGTAELYYTGPQFPSTIALHNLHYFIPYLPDCGIRDVYEITGIRTIKGNEAKQQEGSSDKHDDLRLAFNLRYSRSISDDYRKIDTRGMIGYTFIDTTFSDVEKRITE
ncbi:MAG: hypothetical protein NC344_08455 [Bacteroidales bacterium]|nr:hypothetical protein [Bacteroidales bacterium]MCM1147841.1 hypothetical protein [Bacteroidales bacterium]MCM1206684.1 hypothetical protein [Bacillota bacterium]MCM1510880.1 hypothetical protein [Clostridium sp.]